MRQPHGHLIEGANPATAAADKGGGGTKTSRHGCTHRQRRQREHLRAVEAAAGGAAGAAGQPAADRPA
eukprot:COSAG01_NODE_27433_length_685_cov_9.578498_1_plen_67_part_10